MNAAHRHSALLANFVAAACATGAIIEPVDQAPWLDHMRAGLPQPYPPLFDAFLCAYAFLPFDFAGVSFFANTGESAPDDLGQALFKDQGIFGGSAPHGFLQFGRPTDGSYDPVCFDLNRSRGEDAPIVRLDHEAILRDFRVSIRQQLALSFQALITCEIQII